MNYRPVGKSDLLVSEIGFGCMSLGDDYRSSEQLLHKAFDQGIILFDTADLYNRGQNESLVGRALADRRQQVVLATKVGNQWRPDGSGWDWNPTKPYILQAAEESLRRLQTDYIDLYQLHGGTLDDSIDDSIDAFELLKQQGKIRHYGISSIRPAVIREWVRRSNMVSVMMQYSLLERRPEETCLDLLHEHQIGVLARGSLAKGQLIDKPAMTYLNYSPRQVQEMATAVATLATVDRSVVATAVQFVLHHPAVAAAVIGIRTIDQLVDAVQAGQSAALTPVEWQHLATLLPANQYDQHR